MFNRTEAARLARVQAEKAEVTSRLIEAYNRRIQQEQELAALYAKAEARRAAENAKFAQWYRDNGLTPPAHLL